MIRIILLSTAILLGSCASNGPTLTDFMDECLATPEMSRLTCTYTAYNTAVTAVNIVVKEKHAQKIISTETKDAYKTRILELNAIADEALEVGDITKIETQQDVIKILHKLLNRGLGPFDEAQL